MARTMNGDVEIYYETFGDRSNPAFLLINGLGSQCINFRSAMCEQLAAAGYFVIRFDNRDVGLSTHLTAVAQEPERAADGATTGEPGVAYRLVDMAGDTVAVLDALGIARAHVMGVSMGGMIAQQTAISHPDRVISLTSVMSSTGESDAGHASREAASILMGPPARNEEEYVAAQVAGARTWGSPEFVDVDDVTRRAREAFARSFDPAGVRRQFLAIRASGSRLEALRALRVPTLVIHGDRDTLIDISGGRRTAEVIPAARFEVIEGMGHDYPEPLWNVLILLMTDHAAASA